MGAVAHLLIQIESNFEKHVKESKDTAAEK